MTTVVLHNVLMEDPLTPGHWTVGVAMDRWHGIREKLYELLSTVDDDTQEMIEQLCFIVDEVLHDSTEVGRLTSYAEALQEISDVLLSETSDLLIQTLIAGELQKLALPS